MDDLEGAREAYRIGLRRYDTARRLGLLNPRNCARDPRVARRHDGYGAVAEWTVARATGRAWVGRDCVGHGDGGEDVSGGVQVKWTSRAHGCLIVQADNRQDLRYVLVTGTLPPMRIHGWAHFWEAARVEYWREDVRWPAFFAPQKILHGMETLP